MPPCTLSAGVISTDLNIMWILFYLQLHCSHDLNTYMKDAPLPPPPIMFNCEL